MMNKPDILKRLKESRKSKSLSQQEAAEKLGWDRTVICKIESGSRGLEIDELLQLANLYDVKPEYFIAKHSSLFLTEEPLLDVLNILEKQENQSESIKEAILLIAGEAYKSDQISSGRYREIIQNNNK
ncbi:MAG: helix-turn-helix domain-containing protein [Waterburya sp.]